MKPRLSILSKHFAYRNSAQTDVAATIERERQRIKEEAVKQGFNQHRIIAIGRKKA